MTDIPADYWEQTRKFWYRKDGQRGQWYEHPVWWLDLNNIDYIGPTGVWVLKEAKSGT